MLCVGESIITSLEDAVLFRDSACRLNSSVINASNSAYEPLLKRGGALRREGPVLAGLRIPTETKRVRVLVRVLVRVFVYKYDFTIPDTARASRKVCKSPSSSVPVPSAEGGSAMVRRVNVTP